MVEFVLSPKITAFQYAFVALHGLTDLRHPARIVPYMLVAMPLHGALLTALFLVASVAHFSGDIGAVASVLFHLLLWRLYACNMRTQALECVLLYMVFLHAPMHYVRVLSENTQSAHTSVAFALCATSVAAVFCKSGYRGNVKITHAAQRLIVAHVLSTQMCANI